VTGLPHEGREGALARPILAANWKMNLGPVDALAFMAAYMDRAPARLDRTVIIFPPSLSLAAVRECAAARTDIRLGVQNLYWEDKGAFTGELSAPMARSAGATFALVGHSERRHIFHETDADTSRKCAATVRAGLTPVLCVGETLEQRQAGETEAVVLRQLRAGLSLLEAHQIAKVVVAYEPVWAIGTGRTATPADASATHVSLHAALRALVPRGAIGVPVLYGGSVNAGNAAALLSAIGVDGLLVGGASCDPESWATIVGAQLAG
jgi:triosephosphate isomerase (TIM)